VKEKRAQKIKSSERVREIDALALHSSGPPVEFKRFLA
jgi:hypothetical protein